MIWVALIVIILLFIYNYIQISKPYINNVNIKSNKIKRSLKITQITDFHSNKYIDLDKLCRDIKSFNPDIIVLTGDIIDRKDKNLDLPMNLMKKIREINNNIIFVPGNHEDRNPLYPELQNKIKKLNINILNNESTSFFLDNEKVTLVGVNFQINREEYNNVLYKINNDNLTILLSHSPNKPIEYLTGKENVILSGHTHGGQIRIPFIGPIITPGQGLFPKYDKGINEIQGSVLYIDSGLGNSFIPIRFLNKVQISNITVEIEKPII